jgi:hypothetical protein
MAFRDQATSQKSLLLILIGFHSKSVPVARSPYGLPNVQPSPELAP